jgi:nucleoside-diphosphate-sugar epimerase
MKKKVRVLVTGGTGFLGDHVMPLLNEVAHVTLLSRSRPGCLRGDLTRWNGDLEPAKLKGAFDVMLHMAGLYDLRVEKPEAYLQNMGGTHTALAIASQAEIPRFIHISTVAVTINNHSHIVGPDDLVSSAPFPDHYAESKANAEKIVRHWASSTLKSRIILRPGILVGDTKGGKILRIDGPYHAPESFQRIRRLIEAVPGAVPLPGDETRPLPLVPVDVCARAIVEILLAAETQDWNGTRSFFLAGHQGPTALELFRSAFQILGIKKDIKLLSQVPDWILKPAAEFIAKLPKEELEYLINFPKFDLTATEAVLGPNWCPNFKDYEDVFWRGYHAYISNR